MIRLSLVQILELYNKMIDASGGENGLRSISALESSIENAFITFEGTDLYKSARKPEINM